MKRPRKVRCSKCGGKTPGGATFCSSAKASGRLVRRSSDGGVVVVLDRRVVNRYLREFAASMPWSQRNDGLGVIESYFAPARGRA